MFFVIFWFIAAKTTFGRSVYAVGGNPEAARISGISLMRVRVAIFAGTGVIAAVAAVLISSLIGSGNGGIGQGAEFQVIAAVIVGGTSLYGGRGSMFGTLLGVLFIAFLTNGMVLMGGTSTPNRSRMASSSSSLCWPARCFGAAASSIGGTACDTVAPVAPEPDWRPHGDRDRQPLPNAVTQRSPDGEG